MSQAVIDLIIKTAEELSDQEELELDGDMGPATRLFGEGGVLDSMGLVSLVIAVEQEIEEKFGVSVALADEKALSRRNSPYRTVQSLAEYAGEQIEAARSHA